MKVLVSDHGLLMQYVNYAVYIKQGKNTCKWVESYLKTAAIPGKSAIKWNTMIATTDTRNRGARLQSIGHFPRVTVCVVLEWSVFGSARQLQSAKVLRYMNKNFVIVEVFTKTT